MRSCFVERRDVAVDENRYKRTPIYQKIEIKWYCKMTQFFEFRKKKNDNDKIYPQHCYSMHNDRAKNNMFTYEAMYDRISLYASFKCVFFLLACIFLYECVIIRRNF